MVNIWQTTVDESWSAFAPGFEELEENREYEEREDEFDIVSIHQWDGSLLLPLNLTDCSTTIA
jgi:hypothetical protein